jgi:quercetin dioxygenase-like cupin family protein
MTQTAAQSGRIFAMRLRHGALVVAGIASAWSGIAPADPVRTILQQHDLPASPQTATLGRVLIKAGEPAMWHVHAGIETGYVLAGTMRLSVAGAPDVTLGPGQSFLVPRGTAHASHAVGDGDATVISTWVTDTGVPLATPATPPRQP